MSQSVVLGSLTVYVKTDNSSMLVCETFSILLCYLMKHNV